MIYLNEVSINQIGINWNETINEIENAVKILSEGDYVQPLKPYLRFNNFKNRIIAMPSYLGGNVDVAGIKWISSFPENITKNISRAHSVVILNDSKTGIPICIINTPLLSIVRTASVSGFIIKNFINSREINNFTVGIIGWGPIGQYHYKMCNYIFGDKIANFLVYDLDFKNLDVSNLDSKIIITNEWKDAYIESDVVITCTVSDKPYINLEPKKDSIHLNVSLRDYTPDSYKYFKDAIVVDDWDEVCRESTDIEVFHKQEGLLEKDVYHIQDVLKNKFWNDISIEYPIMFNFMGMSIFDIAISSYFFKKASEKLLGINL